MPFEQIQYAVRDQVATITLNRPEKLNAWTAQMDREVREAMSAAGQDEEVRVILLTGAGRGFCAGADMSLLSNVVQGARPELRRQGVYFMDIPKLVVGAVNGPAVGLGFILALYCDLRIVSSAAKFGTAFARRGLIAEYGLSWMLPRMIGLGNAMDLLLSARIIDAAEAQRMGLCSAVAPEAEFAGRAHAFAAELAAGVSPRSTRVIKRQVYAALQQSFDEALRVAEEEMLQSLQCQDFQEGVAHFLERRAPAFTGR
jgi:enoyl-CoA hydratase/carnithine racemase